MVDTDLEQAAIDATVEKYRISNATGKKTPGENRAKLL